MGVIRFLRRLVRRGGAGAARPGRQKPSGGVDAMIRELQRKLLRSARENQLPRTGA